MHEKFAMKLPHMPAPSQAPLRRDAKSGRLNPHIVVFAHLTIPAKEADLPCNE